MKTPDQNSRGWEERLGAWIGARWRLLVVAVLLLFALNSLVGLAAGAVGLLFFVNRIAGRLLSARRVVQQVQQIVGDQTEPAEEARPGREG